jgi:tetratricopeptide (TPR) repeat protein
LEHSTIVVGTFIPSKSPPLSLVGIVARQYSYTFRLDHSHMKNLSPIQRLQFSLCVIWLVLIPATVSGQRPIQPTEPQDAMAYVSLFNSAVESYRIGKPEQAIQAFQLTLKYNPNDFDAYSYLAEAYRQTHQRDEEIASYQNAIVAYRRAIALTPANVALQSKLCSALLEVGRYWEANDPCRQAIKLEPRNPSHYMKFGMYHEGLKNYENAARAYLLAVDLKPDFVEARHRLGFVYYKLGHYKEAVAALKLAELLEPSNAAVQSTLATVAAGLRRMWESDNSSKNGQSLQSLADAFRLLDHHREAVTLYKRALLRGANNVQLHCDLGLTYYILGRYPEAIKEYESAVAIDAGTIEARDKLNWINHFLGRKRSPIELSRKSHK